MRSAKILLALPWQFGIEVDFSNRADPWHRLNRAMQSRCRERLSRRFIGPDVPTWRRAGSAVIDRVAGLRYRDPRE
jgi:hypothetical protein